MQRVTMPAIDHTTTGGRRPRRRRDGGAVSVVGTRHSSDLESSTNVSGTSEISSKDPTALGINMPARTAVIEKLSKFTGDPRGPSCVLVASRNGAAQIEQVIANARQQCPVFVVSDASTDETAQISRRAGATVLELTENVGKPAAINAALNHFQIAERFETVVVIDDDTTILPDFVRQCLAYMRGGVAIVVGKTESDWRHEARWNPWVASRAFGYWRYQLFVRRGQSVFNVMNCISGSNSMYRTELLTELTSRPTPYIVDDTYWTLETHRRKLGRIVFAPGAVAAVQDPTDVSSWYRQNLRWLWGTMQGIRGHRVGLHASWFDVAYLGVMLDWVLYVALWPLLMVATLVFTETSLLTTVAFYLLGYLAWAVVGAVALRRWRLIILFPALIVIDWLYRALYMHALIRTIRQPRVENCVWDSPARFETSDSPIPSIPTKPTKEMSSS